MIKYTITLAQLSARIRRIDANWFVSATAALAKVPAVPKSTDFEGLWTDIKAVYIKLQKSKCCFCEKSLEGKIEQDVEHFRPKTQVKVWAVPTRLSQRGVAPTNGVGQTLGYRLLAYHPFNYAMSCKFCNSVLKKNYFPIAAAQNLGGNDPTQLLAEQPYLIYPIGNFDADPERLITFQGLSPKAVAANGLDAQRAWVTIRLFRLGSVTKRPILFTARARLLRHLYVELQGRDTAPNAAKRDEHQQVVDNLTNDVCPFANCMRSFEKLYRNDRAMADAFASACLKYLKSKGIRV